jgi:hypothetical protein
VVDTPDVEKAEQHYFDLSLGIHGFFGVGEFFDLHSMNWHLALGSY